MKPQQKKIQNQQREKGFDVFLQGANKDRVNKKNKDQQKPARNIKKWKEEKQIGSLDNGDLDVLRKSLVQGNVLSKSQQELLEKLQRDTPIDVRYDPHFSQLIDDEEDYQFIEEEDDELCESEEDPQEIIEIEEIQEIQEQQEIQPPPPPPSQQKAIQVVNLPATKLRPQSGMNSIDYQSISVSTSSQNQKQPMPIKSDNKYASKPQLKANLSAKKDAEIKQDTKQENKQETKLQAQQVVKQENQPDHLEDIFNRIEKLTPSEKQQLLLFLSKKDQIESPYEDKQQQIQKKPDKELVLKIDKQPQPERLQMPLVVEKKVELILNIDKQQPQPQQKYLAPDLNELIIKPQNTNFQLKLRILSTWGNPSMVGLTEIELYTIEGSKLQLESYNIKMINAQSLKLPEIIINGKSLTRDPFNMWLGSMPDPPKTIEIEMSYDQGHLLGGIKVFNYNKSLIDSVKGVKDLEVLCYQENKLITKVVEVKKGTGFELDDYGTEIPLMDSFKFPSLHNTQSKFASKIRGAIDQSDILDQQKKLEDSKPPPSRKGKGPIVVDIFKQERPETSKSITKDGMQQNEQQQQQQQQQEQQQQQIRRRDQQPTQDYLEETLQYFNLTHQGRFKPVQRNVTNEEVQPKQVEKKNEDIDEVDALDCFFKAQHNQRQQPIKNSINDKPLSKWDVPQQQQQIQPTQKGRQTQENAQIIKDLLNQPVVNKKQQQKKAVQLPNLPNVRHIQIQIHQTWGDKYYVGLNGIEIFNEFGQLIQIKDPFSQVLAEPSDINVLPEYFNDPRTPDKLVDGVCFTQSDMHVWLSPFARGKTNKIFIDLLEKKKVSMIRIWNYNKSRIHSFRGAREISLLLDGQLVFRGEIRKGCGNMNLQPQMNSNEGPFENLVLSNDENVIQQIIKNDWINQRELQTLDEQTNNNERPNTGNLDTDMRPTTSAKLTNLQNEVKQARQLAQIEQQVKTNQRIVNLNKDVNGVVCKTLFLKIHKPWSEQPYVGLCGIEIYGKDGKIQIKSIKSDPSDMNSIHGFQGDKRVCSNLINGQNITVNEQNMWMIPYFNGKLHQITIQFEQPQSVNSIRIWNYNKSYDESFRGVKYLSISNEQGIIVNKILIKRAPGVDLLDYGQTIFIPYRELNFDLTNQSIKQLRVEYELYLALIGFELKIQLLTTHGDIHYIGLNGLEILDNKGKLIMGNIGADPSSVRILQGMKGDKRVIENLLDGVNETFDDSHMWLAPFTNRCFHHTQDPVINTIYFASDQPFSLGCIRFWNYTKNVKRGAHEISISFDDNLIYRGYLRIANNDGNETAVVFNQELFDRFAMKMHTEFGKKQEVMFRNEEKGVKQNVQYAQLDRPITRVKGSG